jgi:hypothetical protein
MVRIVCLADTHLEHWKLRILPYGEVLVHAGDFTNLGTEHEVQTFADWFAGQEHPKKICIAGNHDFLFQRQPELARKILEDRGIIYLEDQETEAFGLRFYGAPHTPTFHDWAFNLDRGPKIRAKWELIPTGLDVLITHGPAFGWLDDGKGCEDLTEVLMKRCPRLHICGHVHEGYGALKTQERIQVNAALCNRWNQLVKLPIVVDIE